MIHSDGDGAEWVNAGEGDGAEWMNAGEGESDGVSCLVTTDAAASTTAKTTSPSAAVASTTIVATSPSAQEADVHATFKSFLEKRVKDYCNKEVILSNKEVKKFIKQANVSISPKVSGGPPVAASATGEKKSTQQISGLKTHRITETTVAVNGVEGTVQFKIKGSYKVKYSLPTDRLRKVFQRSVAVRDLPKVKICLRQIVKDTGLVALSGPIEYDYVYEETTVPSFDVGDVI